MISLILSGCFEETKPEEKKEKTLKLIIGNNLLKNPGFENISTSGILNEWIFQGVTAENLTFHYDNETKYNGNRSVYINNTHFYENITMNNWVQHINDIPHGKDIALTCWVKAIEAYDAALMLQCWNESWVYANESSEKIGHIIGTNDWEKFYINLSNVPSNTKYITVRLGLKGIGQVWFDDAKLFTIEYKEV